MVARDRGSAADADGRLVGAQKAEPESTLCEMKQGCGGGRVRSEFNRNRNLCKSYGCESNVRLPVELLRCMLGRSAPRGHGVLPLSQGEGRQPHPYTSTVPPRAPPHGCRVRYRTLRSTPSLRRRPATDRGARPTRPVSISKILTQPNQNRWMGMSP
jgi:hypothetical protein